MHGSPNIQTATKAHFRRPPLGKKIPLAALVGTSTTKH
jgi:hypothetical protein